VYPGTEIPKNFQSRVRIENPATGEQREVDIRMNEPLRYGGLTFFQFQMGKEDLERDARGTSTLQVVRNPAWLTPYAGCAIVSAGMLWQFLYHLAGFASRRRKE
jgi:cytochrome c biogenesis protein ResB